MTSYKYPLFVKRDLDGFFGLAIDNLVQLLLIVSLCGSVCGMSGEFSFLIYRYILPGAAVSIVIGNVFYALQAHWVAHRERRSDVTALPYGINTPSLLVYIFFVMKPAFERTGNPTFAWELGLIACLGSGIIEFAGAFVAERFRRSTPRAALLSTLAGIAIAFISMTFALQIWQRPLIAMVPLAIILLTYFARARFPLGLPGGLLAVLVGTAIAWSMTQLLPADWVSVPMNAEAVREAWAQHGTFWPQWVGPEIWKTLQVHPGELITMLSVVIPMGLFNLIGSLQNIESAEAGGDVFATGPSLAVNGICTIAAACFGSCFPTTIYIGHPGWKALGTRAGYSTLNGLAITAICLTGTVLVISKIIPIEAGISIVLWIGIVITAQAFQATPIRHAPAVAIGLFPAIAAWGATLVAGTFIEAARNTSTPPAITATISSLETQPSSTKVATMQDVLTSNRRTDTEISGFLLHGLNILERGYIFTCMIVAAISAFLIDRRFYHAAGWALAAAILTLLGLMHAYQLTGNIVGYLPIFTAPTAGAFVYRGYDLALGYLLMAGLFAFMGRLAVKAAFPPADNTLEDARVTPLLTKEGLGEV